MARSVKRIGSNVVIAVGSVTSVQVGGDFEKSTRAVVVAAWNSVAPLAGLNPIEGSPASPTMLAGPA